MRRSAMLVAAVVAAALWLGVVPRAGAQSPLRIGASLSQTGAFAALGQTQLRGYQLCVKHANEKGGVLGRRIELSAEDDQSDAATPAAIYEQLVARRAGPAKLPHAGEDAVELTEDEHGPLHTLGRPAGHRLQGREDLVKALAEVAQHVIAVDAQAVPAWSAAAVPPTSTVPGTKY